MSDTLLESLKRLHPQSIDLSLGRIERLLAALGNPQDRLPPVVHVAGTNGKGSSQAFLRAIAEAMGKGVHVYTSPHLVNFHERIVLAGPHGAAPVSEEVLVDCLARAEAANSGELITLFESLAEIAGEQAGILKPGVPCVVGRQEHAALEVIESRLLLPADNARLPG